MKWIFIILCVPFLACNTRPVKPVGGTAFELGAPIDTLIDVGVMNEGEVLSYEAKLRNNSAEPIVITNVHTSCGCTEVEYTREPIAVGAEGTLSLRFDSSGMWGPQRKVIAIETSGATHQITLMAEVKDVNRR